jgi:hypothetical protein
MVRNLKHMNRLPRKPMRSCLKNTGPDDTNRTRAAIKTINGNKTGAARRINPQSKTRFHTGAPNGLAKEPFMKGLL